MHRMFGIRSDLVFDRLTIKSASIAIEIPSAFGKMTLLLSRSRKNTHASKLRNIKNKWWKENAKMIQGFADQHIMHNIFQETKAIYGAGSHSSPVPGWDSSEDRHCHSTTMEGAALEPRSCGDRRHHSVHSAASGETIARYILSTTDDVQRVTVQMKCHNACGPGAIPAEILKFCGENLASKLYELIRKI